MALFQPNQTVIAVSEPPESTTELETESGTEQMSQLNEEVLTYTFDAMQALDTSDVLSSFKPRMNQQQFSDLFDIYIFDRSPICCEDGNNLMALPPARRSIITRSIFDYICDKSQTQIQFEQFLHFVENLQYGEFMKILLCKTESNSSAFASQCYSLMSKRRVSKEVAEENDDADDNEDHGIVPESPDQSGHRRSYMHGDNHCYTDASDEKATGFMDIEMEENKAVKRMGRVKKKLKEIRNLEQKYDNGERLLPNQVHKIQQKLHYQEELQRCKQQIFNLRKCSERLQCGNEENQETSTLQRELTRMKLENDALKKQNQQLQDEELNVEDKHFLAKLFAMQCVKQRDYYKLQADDTQRRIDRLLMGYQHLQQQNVELTNYVNAARFMDIRSKQKTTQSRGNDTNNIV